MAGDVVEGTEESEVAGDGDESFDGDSASRCVGDAAGSKVVGEIVGDFVGSEVVGGAGGDVVVFSVVGEVEGNVEGDSGSKIEGDVVGSEVVVGDVKGVSEGDNVGEVVGDVAGFDKVGEVEGDIEGDSDGETEGGVVGSKVVGRIKGNSEGDVVGETVGDRVGPDAVGEASGIADDIRDGRTGFDIVGSKVVGGIKGDLGANVVGNVVGDVPALLPLTKKSVGEATTWVHVRESVGLDVCDTVRSDVVDEVPKEPYLASFLLLDKPELSSDSCVVGAVMDAITAEARQTSRRPNRMRRCHTQSHALFASCGHRVYRFPDLSCMEPSCCMLHSPSSLSSV